MKINIDSPIIHALNTIFDVVITTVYFIIGCIPVVTAGASFAAMQSVMMRIAAILKRCGAPEDGHERVTMDGLTVDFTARRVTIDGENISLSPKEYELLFYMVRNRGIALTREKLISEVWGYDFYGDDRTLDTHIKLLRKSLGDYASRITTLRGVGYRFEKD
jgi:DNA-binding response OmpR family regulator